MIYPEIFDGKVKAFFTGKTVGADIEKIRCILSIKKEDIFLPVQKHTDVVFVVESDCKPVIADAVVTERKGLLIGVQVADCVPVLLFDRKKSIIGAVHAGWRGTAAQIVKKTIDLMIKYFNSSPEDILVAFGPSIRGCCYRVNQDVQHVIYKATGDGRYYSERSEGGYVIDISAANMLQAMSLGVPERNIWSSNECTHCNPRDYHSYRYHGNYTGRQGGFIGIF